jgi:hypothetical protein
MAIHILKAIAFSFDLAQDRILAVVNPGALDSWAFWLTRRLVRTLLARLPTTLEKSSPLAKQAPADHRSEIVAFEKEAAMASTAPAMSQTDNSIMRNNAAAAELAVQLSLSEQGDGFRLVLQGERGGQAAGVVGRAELQRILQMLQGEAAKAGWMGQPTQMLAADEAHIPGTKPVRH